MDRIKVLQVIEHLNIGGREKMFVELVLGLDRTRFDPVVVTFMGGRLEVALQQKGVKVLRAGGQCRLNRISELIRLMREEHVQLVHTHMFSAGTWGRIAALLYNVPVKVHTHASLTFQEKRRKRLLPEMALTASTDRVICVSEAVRNHLSSTIGMWAGKMVVIPNGIDASRFNFSRFSLHAPPSLVAVGRLEKVKGFDILIRAVAIVRARGVDVRCTIAGDGTEMGHLRELAEHLNVAEHVTFAGYVKNILPLLQASDLLVAPSYREGLSNAILEAMAAGLPVIASRVGGNKELLKDTGWLVPPGDEDALSKTLVEVLQEPQKALEMGSLSKTKILQDYTLSKMIEKHEKLYLYLLQKKSII